MKATLSRSALLAILTLALFSVCHGPASGEVYPSRTVKIIVPYPPGGPGDTVGRIIAQKLSERLGQSFYVENLPGAGGTIGMGAAASANPDGYTILFAVQDLVVQPVIKAKVPYDPFKSFAPITQIVTAPEMIVVHPSLPAHNMRELIELLRANPGKYSYASPGYGTSPHLGCEWLFRLTYGLDVTHVPFQGAAPAVISTVAGQTPIFHNTLPTVAPYIKDGKLRALAVASRERTPMFPDVPTLEEALIPGHEIAYWLGALVPARTPGETVQLLQREIATIVALADVKERLVSLGFDPVGDTSTDFAERIRSEFVQWKKVVADADIKID